MHPQQILAISHGCNTNSLKRSPLELFYFPARSPTQPDRIPQVLDSGESSGQLAACCRRQQLKFDIKARVEQQTLYREICRPVNLQLIPLSFLPVLTNTTGTRLSSAGLTQELQFLQCTLLGSFQPILRFFLNIHRTALHRVPHTCSSCATETHVMHANRLCIQLQNAKQSVLWKASNTGQNEVTDITAVALQGRETEHKTEQESCNFKIQNCLQPMVHGQSYSCHTEVEAIEKLPFTRWSHW